MVFNSIVLHWLFPVQHSRQKLTAILSALVLNGEKSTDWTDSDRLKVATSDSDNSTGCQSFTEGWLARKKVLVGADDFILASGDCVDAIYRVSYAGEKNT
ncbi:hypothetical protein FKG94_06255 [Exilibacterium tricleocarpae]|uniref:Uncharacterized protein n=2 Tax=Exilibacterium tricleocarpae TaxID=2591008 RepID=A0A545U481_9GAMM|nr:hypothetical protein FKG94_06255 [Exilibacterium tricleocarpae]